MQFRNIWLFLGCLSLNLQLLQVFCFLESRSQLNRIWTILSLETGLWVSYCQSVLFVNFGLGTRFCDKCGSHPQLWMLLLPSLYICPPPPKLTCNNFSPKVKTLLKLLCFGSSQLGGLASELKMEELNNVRTVSRLVFGNFKCKT